MGAGLLISAFGKALPPATDHEINLVNKLRARFRTLQDLQPAEVPSTETAWINHTSRLNSLVLDGDPREFLRWDVIHETMFVSHPEFIWTELRYLIGLPDWKNRWRKAVKESRAGHPIPYPLYPKEQW